MGRFRSLGVENIRSIDFPKLNSTPQNSLLIGESSLTQAITIREEVVEEITPSRVNRDFAQLWRPMNHQVYNGTVEHLFYERQIPHKAKYQKYPPQVR